MKTIMHSAKLKDMDRIHLAALLTIAKASAGTPKEVSEGEVFMDFLTMLSVVVGRGDEIEGVLKPTSSST